MNGRSSTSAAFIHTEDSVSFVSPFWGRIEKFSLVIVSSYARVEVVMPASGEGATVAETGIQAPVRELPSFSVVVGRTERSIVPL